MSKDTRDDLKDRSLPDGSFLAFDFRSGRVAMVAEETLANPAILLLMSSSERYVKCRLGLLLEYCLTYVCVRFL